MIKSSNLDVLNELESSSQVGWVKRKVQPNNHQVINHHHLGFRASTQPTGDRTRKTQLK